MPVKQPRQKYIIKVTEPIKNNNIATKHDKLHHVHIAQGTLHGHNSWIKSSTFYLNLVNAYAIAHILLPYGLTYWHITLTCQHMWMGCMPQAHKMTALVT